jgi:hypothetical protein
MRAKEDDLGKDVVWTIPCVCIRSGTAMWKPAWWRGTCPAHVPDFFMVFKTGVYYDLMGWWWNRPVYRQR